MRWLCCSFSFFLLQAESFLLSGDGSSFSHGSRGVLGREGSRRGDCTEWSKLWVRRQLVESGSNMTGPPGVQWASSVPFRPPIEEVEVPLWGETEKPSSSSMGPLLFQEERLPEISREKRFEFLEKETTPVGVLSFDLETETVEEPQTPYEKLWQALFPQSKQPKTAQNLFSALPQLLLQRAVDDLRVVGKTSLALVVPLLKPALLALPARLRNALDFDQLLFDYASAPLATSLRSELLKKLEMTGRKKNEVIARALEARRRRKGGSFFSSASGISPEQLLSASEQGGMSSVSHTSRARVENLLEEASRDWQRTRAQIGLQQQTEEEGEGEAEMHSLTPLFSSMMGSEAKEALAKGGFLQRDGEPREASPETVRGRRKGRRRSVRSEAKAGRSSVSSEAAEKENSVERGGKLDGVEAEMLPSRGMQSVLPLEESEDDKSVELPPSLSAVELLQCQAEHLSELQSGFELEARLLRAAAAATNTTTSALRRAASGGSTSSGLEGEGEKAAEGLEGLFERQRREAEELEEMARDAGVLKAYLLRSFEAAGKGSSSFTPLEGSQIASLEECLVEGGAARLQLLSSVMRELEPLFEKKGEEGESEEEDEDENPVAQFASAASTALSRFDTDAQARRREMLERPATRRQLFLTSPQSQGGESGGELGEALRIHGLAAELALLAIEGLEVVRMPSEDREARKEGGGVESDLEGESVKLSDFALESAAFLFALANFLGRATGVATQEALVVGSRLSSRIRFAMGDDFDRVVKPVIEDLRETRRTKGGPSSSSTDSEPRGGREASRVDGLSVKSGAKERVEALRAAEEEREQQRIEMALEWGGEGIGDLLWTLRSTWDSEREYGGDLCNYAEEFS